MAQKDTFLADAGPKEVKIEDTSMMLRSITVEVI